MNEPENLDRNDVIKAIKKSLKERSGKVWSVTGGRGTAYGWISIDAPPARRTWTRGNDGEFDTGIANSGYMSPEEREELKRLLGIESIGRQGVSIADSNAHYREYLARARGEVPAVIGRPYWD